MNKVILRGNLTRDVEIKTTQSGKKMAKFNVAIRRDYKNAEGNYESDFMNCVAYSNLADLIEKYFHTGSGIFLEGHLQTGSYKKEDGTKIYTTDVIIEKIEFDRRPSENKKENEFEEKSDAEIIASVANDEYERKEEQVEAKFELPF